VYILSIKLTLIPFFFADQTGMRDMASAKDIVSSIISAANKKIQRRRKNQDEIDNSEQDNDKVSNNRNLFIYILIY